MKILHITVHLGGGIGSAYVGLGDCGHQQKIILLEEPIDLHSVNNVERAGFEILCCPNKESVVENLKTADVVLINWTHHPAIIKFLVDFPMIPVRCILWCHVSGNYYPCIPTDFIQKFSQVLFATPYSLHVPQIEKLDREYIDSHFHVVYGLNDLSRFWNHEIEKKCGEKEYFTIGYVGTLGFCKLNPRFVDYCAAVDIPNVRFLMVGTPTTKEHILSQAKQKGIADRFKFSGQISDVTEALQQMDAFGYLLNPQHFGATENSLLEAMAFGLPVIALRQCVERYIVRDGETGFLVDSPEEYGRVAKQLWRNTTLARQLGERAKLDTRERYNVKRNREQFVFACNQALLEAKKVISFHDVFRGDCADWFLKCVKEDRECFEENRAGDAGLIFHENTKGSPKHFYKYFPYDTRLALWAEQLK